MKNISHFISSIDKKFGGPSRSVTHILNGLINQNKEFNFNLYTKISEKPIIKKFSNPQAKLFFLQNLKFGLAKGLKKEINKKCHKLFHFHGVWNTLLIQVYFISKKKKIPLIISPRGMMEPWPLYQKKLKKKILRQLIIDRVFKNSFCIHATSESEAYNLRKLGFTNPIAVIPNGVVIQDFPDYNKKFYQKKKLLFLSRIHKKKGIENLIDAWRLIDFQIKKNWFVEIVGNGRLDYINFLKDKIRLNGLEDSMKILNPVFGKNKIKLYQSADLFVLPSYSENFGNVVAEALASKVPVITTKGTPWTELDNINAGWCIEIGVDPLKQALIKAIQIDQEKLYLMGLNGRKLIEKKYTIEVISIKMTHLYRWVLKGGDKPPFVN